MRYIFIASCIMYYSWSVFNLCCVFAVFNKVGPHHILFWRETRSAASYLLWSKTRSAVMHIYFGVRHAPLFCIMFTLEGDTLCCYASCLLWSETRSTCFAYERSIFIAII